MQIYPSCRGILHDTHSSLSPITALAHVKSRALLSIESDSSLSKYDSNPPGLDKPSKAGGGAGNNALMPVGVESTAMTTLELEERIRKWKVHMGGQGARDLPTQQIPARNVCSCPERNEARNNLTSIKL